VPTVCLIRPPGYPHAEALAELEETVRYGLEALGAWGGPPRIVLGAHYGHDLTKPGDIIYNTEHPSSGWLAHRSYVGLLSTHEVWDYRPLGVGKGRRAKYVPIGYVPQLTRIPKADPQDIDVLFYGSMNDRRAKVLTELREAGLAVVNVFGVYGKERDALIARSKVVLNMHYYEPGEFESVRVSYLWANRKCVVSEEGRQSPQDNRVEYDRLASVCQYLAERPDQRAKIEDRDFGRFSQRSEAGILREALCGHL
jgi:hypothetical protein